MTSLGIDVLFAAGNCGQFCPDNRCGGLDRGPSRSIWGANSLQHVLTVGAVRADDMWLGYSSQGPGQQFLGKAKPDFCATSQFAEDDDGFNINTGTSAATGLTAGVIAALRSRWNSATVSPQALQQILHQTARKPTSVPWTNSHAPSPRPRRTRCEGCLRLVAQQISLRARAARTPHRTPRYAFGNTLAGNAAQWS